MDRFIIGLQAQFLLQISSEEPQKTNKSCTAMYSTVLYITVPGIVLLPYNVLLVSPGIRMPGMIHTRYLV